MKTLRLGNAGPIVSRLCFGTLTVGPTQKNFKPADAAALMIRAAEMGVNFFDTAEVYGNYDSLALLLKSKPDVVITSKSYAITWEQMRQSIEIARQALNRDYIDIFMLHEVENAATFRGHQGAIEYLLEAKVKGIIGAAGISTHTVAGARAGATHPGIDVIHPLINYRGIGIKDGSVTDMIAAIQTAKEFGKGIYAMKALAGGHLTNIANQAIQFVNGLSCIDAIAIGIQSEAELALNIQLLQGEEPVPELVEKVQGVKRRLLVADYCQVCGRCVERCGFGALQIIEGRLVINDEKCVRCGYCARVCPEFCLKIG